AIIGAKLTLLGFFKKICVADLLAGYVNAVYNNPGNSGAFGIILATLFFAIEIYCDFSGYTDIAIGVSRIMGIRLMKNFDKPYSAKTVTEFWSRWHISLSSWFRDYLYIPLGGSRCKKWRHLLNLFIVFLASGLWHGAALTFVIWGAFHGAVRVLSELTFDRRNRILAKLGISPDSRFIAALRTVNTFLIVLFSWMIFRANSLKELGVLISGLFRFDIGVSATLSAMELGAVEILLVILSLMTLFLLDRLIVYGEEAPVDSMTVKNGSFIFAVFSILSLWLLLLSRDMISTFIYFQF
ncbi:MAG: MBOAT family protein, partial [Clostridia bacterium]|nr:MBOAT family protein [Clostridia bacterium]